MKIFRLTVALLSAAIFSCAFGMRASASENSAVMAVFDNAISAFNRNDLRAWIATCAPSAGIIDEIPPHSWQGSAACANWWRSFQSFASSNRLTQPSVLVGRPLHLEITGRAAYMVAPATYLYHQNGKAQREAGMFTVAFRKTLNGWLMSGWTWTLR